MPSRKQRKKAHRPKDGDRLTFNHVMVYVRNVAPSLHFYADLLGFKLIDEFSYNGRPVYARLQSPQGLNTVALHQLEPGKTLSETQGVRLYFEVKNVEKACEKLKAAGVQLSQEPKLMPWGWKHAYLNDPDGHEISLYWAGSKRFRKTTMSPRSS